jgi:hypothetical protein
MLDVIRLFDDYNIRYEITDSGHQIKTNCFVCNGKSKLWIRTDSEVFYCHRCAWTPNDVNRFVSLVTGLKGIRVLPIVKKYQKSKDTSDFTASVLKSLQCNKASRIQKEPMEIPPGCVPLEDPNKQRGPKTQAFFKYLTGPKVINNQKTGYRDFKWEDIEHLNLYGCIKGKYRDRLILPVYYKGDLVFWQARTIDKSEDVYKYLTPKGYSPSKCVFNVEQASQYEYTILCEGYFSATRTGDDAVATFGNKISTRQIEILKENNVDRVILAFDPDSWFIPEHIRKNRPFLKAPMVSAMLKCLGRFKEIRVAILESGDPDELGRDATREKIKKSQRISSQNDIIQIVGDVSARILRKKREQER